jgi:hypothetical protein
MGNLGVFRDDFYNAVFALTAAQAIAGPVATGVIPAATLAGATECYTSVGGTSQTYTTDTAVNIIAQIQQAVAAAQKANVGGFASALGGTPPLGVPNLFNVSWYININVVGVTTGATLAAGTGVTITTMTGVGSATALTPAMVNVGYVATITSATTVTLTRVV